MTVVDFPTPGDAMGDAELARHLGGAMGIAVNENEVLELERDIYRSAWRSATQRLDALKLARETRRLHLLLAGGMLGGALTLILEGAIARWLA